VSYYTRVTIEFSADPPGVDEALTAARAWLVAQRAYAVDAVLSDLRRGWTEGQTEFSDLVCQDVEGLMGAVSAQHPGIRFYVRGMGEEFTDVWLRQFESGRVVFAVGPFEPGDE
jgi:hypothetical protein